LLHRARRNGHNQPARETDRLPGLSAIVAPEHAAPVRATPRTAVNERVRNKARGTVGYTACRRRIASLNVNDDDLAIGGD
jgi:hypothetical protein